jgi:hypothetical protein
MLYRLYGAAPGIAQAFVGSPERPRALLSSGLGPRRAPQSLARVVRCCEGVLHCKAGGVVASGAVVTLQP